MQTGIGVCGRSNCTEMTRECAATVAITTAIFAPDLLALIGPREEEDRRISD